MAAFAPTSTITGNWQLEMVYLGYFGRAADVSGYTYWAGEYAARVGGTYKGVAKQAPADAIASIAASFGAAGQSETVALYPFLGNTSVAFPTTDAIVKAQITAFVKAVYVNLFNRTLADTDTGLAYWVNNIASGKDSSSTAILAIANAAGADGTTQSLTDAKVLNNKLAASDNFLLVTSTAGIGVSGAVSSTVITEARTIVASVTDNAATVTSAASSLASWITAQSAVAGQNYALTTGTDRLVGTAGNDTFDGTLSSGGAQTFGSSDSLDGGTGSDTLIATFSTSVTPSTITSVETISATNITNASTLDLSNAVGVTTVNMQGSTVLPTLQGISKVVAVNIKDSSAGATVTYNDVSGTSDAATIGVSNVTGGTLTVAGVETLTLNSTGSASSGITLTAAAATKLIIGGNKALTLTTTPAATVIDGSGFTGTGADGITLTTTATSSTTVLGGSGNDSITMGAGTGADSVSAGDGNDTITYTANLGTTDTIDGGAGTDTLASTSALLTGYTKPTPVTISNFETIKFTDALGAAFTSANVQTGISTVDLNAGSGAFAVTMEAGAKTVKIGAANTGTLTINDTGVATNDTLTISNNSSSVDVFGGNALAINGYETTTISTTGKAGNTAAQTVSTITLTPDNGGTSSLIITGSNSLTTTGAITANIIDASGLSGTAVLTMGAAAASVTSIIGGLNADTLVGDTSSSIDGGAGNDTITGGTGNDTLLGGAGNDSITSGGGNDSIDGGAGNDTVISTGLNASGQTIIGGDGTDILSVKTSAATAAGASSVSGFETLQVETTGVTQDMSVFLGNPTFTKIQATTGTISFTNMPVTVTAAATTAAVTSLTATRLVDGLNDSLTLSVKTATTLTTFVDSTDENLTIQSSSTGAVTVSTLTAAELSKLTLTGSGNVTVSALTNASSVASLLTVDASALSGAATVNASGSSIAVSFTGSNAGSNTFTGTAGVDTIVGGSQADTLKSGTTTNGSVAGEDVLTGGAGADTLVVTATGNASTTGASHVSSFITITDFEWNSDIISFYTGGAAVADIVTGSTASSGTAAISTAGLATFNVADNTLAKKIVATEAGINASGVAAAGQAAMFISGSDSYVFISDGNDGVDANDLVIKLTGVSVTTHTLTDGGTTFTIV